MFFNSNDKDKFVVGATYWTYYMDRSNKYNKLRDWTGVFQVKVISNEYKTHTTIGYNKKELTYFTGHTNFEVLYSVKPIKSNVQNNYLSGYGNATCDFYDTKEECIQAHDKQIIDWATNLNTDDRNVMCRKLYTKIKPPVKQIETDSINWYNNLSKQEQNYVYWIKKYYEF